MPKIENKNKAAFINRKEELNFLNKGIAEEPGNILFIYGPKSSGKTTLLYKMINEEWKDNKKYNIKHFNLREILIVNYKTFLQSFFEIDYSKDKKDVKEIRQYGFGKLFGVKVEVLKGLDEKTLDPFKVMKKELEKINDKGIKPIIIIDELQALENIYMEEQRELLKEMFNFFVSITKETHLAHVIIASSDGYFIERIYNDSKLKKTSKFMEVDYLDKKDVEYWLNNLKKESNIEEYILSDKQKQAIWDNFGGSVWEISAFLGDLLMGAENNKVTDEYFKKVLDKKLIAARSMFVDYVGFFTEKEELFKEINKLNKNSHDHSFKEKQLKRLLVDKFYDQVTIRKELTELVRQNFISYNPTTAEYKIQGRSMEIGLDMFVDQL